MGDPDLEPAEAYGILAIPDRTLDEGVITDVYHTRLQDEPTREREFSRALKSILADKARQRQAEAVGLERDLPSTLLPLQESPVGLRNLGVTCYLNSVVQLLFSLKPFRDVVLNFENHKMDITPQNLQHKRVGFAMRTAKEVELSQQCKLLPIDNLRHKLTPLVVYELAKLFENMIHDDSRVTQYDTNFARLALASLPKDTTGRRRSTASGHRPSLMQDVQSEQHLQTLPEVEKEDSKQKSLIEATGSRTSSQETLVNVPLTEPSRYDESKDVSMADVNTPRSALLRDHGPSTTQSIGNQTLMSGISNDDSVDKSVESTQNTMNDDDSTMIESAGRVNDHGEEVPSAVRPPTATNPPPTRAAPKPELPPRPEKDNTKDTQLSAVEDTAKQQDVAEVTDNIVSKLRTAIKPAGFDSVGEQIDQIRR